MKKFNYKKLAKCVGLMGLAILPSISVFGQTATPKNIIMVIGDGMSHTMIEATNYYQGKRQAYEDFPVMTWSTTYNARNPKGTLGEVGAVSAYQLEYRSDLAWTDFNWVARSGSYTDSAPAATALATGVKTADGVLNFDVDGNQLLTITEHALNIGKRAGVVSNVQLTHATPAGFIAHNMDRNASAAIAREMFASNLSVIIGTGHPDYDNNAQFSAGRQGFNHVGGREVWNDLLEGGLTTLGAVVQLADIDGDAIADPWTLIQDSIAFAQIASGELEAPKRLLGIPRAGTTTQQARSGGNALVAFSSPLNIGVPSLSEKSLAALNVLNNDKGFFVMIEAGAIDWAGHANQAGRMIEDMIELNDAMDAIIQWIEANGGWEENLLILTSDHECGYFIGPNTQDGTVNNPVDNPIIDNGAGNMPGYSYNSGNHTNMLVPVYAKGAGAEMLKSHESRTDFYRGRYIDNTDIASTMFALWTPQAEIKNFIFMISDGLGYNGVTATNYFEGKTQMYEDFPVQSAMSTFHGRAGNHNAANTLSRYSTGYNSHKAWTDFNYLNIDYTDSAPAATAMATGKKSYDGSINVDMNHDPLTTLPQVATAKGKSAGVVSTVQISHATPAGLGGAHNRDRNANAAIAQQLFFDTNLSVAIGTGHPLYNDQGQLRATPNYQWIGADAWNALSTNSVQSGANTARDIDGDGIADAWTLVQDSIDFARIANGEYLPLRLAGIPKVFQTLQQRRAPARSSALPFSTPFNPEMPNLSELSLAALNVLNQNENGFYLMIEGGAIDWANHDNDLVFMIEEQYDFNRAVEAVIDWVEKNSNWGETLLIVTSDHECGYLTGPNEQDNSYSTNPIIDNGAGNLPSHRYNSGNHTNMLVPVYALGVNAEGLNTYKNQYDYVHGYYIDNTNIPHLVIADWNRLENAVPRVSTSLQDVYSDNKANNLLNIYPTIVDSFITIENGEGNTVEIFNLSGQMVFSQTLYSNTINLSPLAKGLYVVKVADKFAKIVKK